MYEGLTYWGWTGPREGAGGWGRGVATGRGGRRSCRISSRAREDSDAPLFLLREYGAESAYLYHVVDNEVTVRQDGSRPSSGNRDATPVVALELLATGALDWECWA